jgi:hypothetical protein
MGLFDESFQVRVPWGKDRGPALEVWTISHPFYYRVKKVVEIYICQLEQLIWPSDREALFAALAE